MAPTTTTPETKTCRCGAVIEPYVIGDHSFTANLCPACIEEEERLDVERAKHKRIARLGFQRRYLDSDFDNLNDPKPAEQIIEACRVYAQRLKNGDTGEGQGLYLWGPNGTGKTHLAVAITKAYPETLFVNTVHLFDEIKKSYSQDTVCDVYESAKVVPLLVLDDLGSERPSDWVRERLYALLSTRWDEMLPTVVTTNLSPAELTQVIGERSASRVLGSCLVMKVSGPDHRRRHTASL